MNAPVRQEVWFPPKVRFLFQPNRYKVLYGGRGSAKSWSIARALLIQGAGQTLRILCAREFLNSLDESAYELLKQQIVALGLSGFYEVMRSRIVGRNGTEFIFAGLHHNIDSIKSKEGIDRVWVEEAANVSKTSWNTLIPTIRKAGSEIWVSFNPELETDETYQRFVVNPPEGAMVERLTWADNPWLSDELRMEKDSLRERDPDSYLWVWEGRCRQNLDGAVYAAELREATEQGRITKVPYDPTKPVHTFWDLGWSDLTSIWFGQAVGFEYRIIRFVQDRQKTVGHYLKLLQEFGYLYGRDYLPHDAESGHLASDGRGVDSLMRAAGRKIVIVPRPPTKQQGINAARTIFGQCWFDEESCSDGLHSLRHYRYEVDENTNQFSRNPLHDAFSHGADAFQTLALSLKAPSARPEPKPRDVSTGRGIAQGWMGR